VLLPDCSPEQATAAAHRMLAAVRALGIAHRASPTADFVTISIGVASVVPSEGTAPEALLQSADQALYLAKQRGRNQVATEPGPR
jgi:diguanylate cyclase (GGDEF)-like protein